MVNFCLFFVLYFELGELAKANNVRQSWRSVTDRVLEYFIFFLCAKKGKRSQNYTPMKKVGST